MEDDTFDGTEKPTFNVGNDPTGIIVAQKFLLKSELGRGGFGVVYEAVDTLLQRKVALKLLHSPFKNYVEGSETIIQRFIHEGQVLAYLRHPNIVTAFEMGPRRDGTYYLALERLYGHNLRKVLELRQRLELRDALDVLIPIMGGLVQLHERHVVHRDLKPENIILSQNHDGEIIPKLIDFGIAKPLQGGGVQTAPGILTASPPYAAPEQFLAWRAPQQLDKSKGWFTDRTDVWAAGVILYELLAGQRPFGSNERYIHECAGERVLHDEMIPPLSAHIAGLPTILVEIIGHALQKEPLRRPDMRYFCDSLTRIRARRSDTGLGNIANELGSVEQRIKPPDTIPPPPPPDPKALEGNKIAENQPKASPEPPPVPTPDTDWLFETVLPQDLPPRLRTELTKSVRRLSINDLTRAEVDARVALSDAKPYPELSACFLLVRSISAYWLGSHNSAKDSARDAVRAIEATARHWHTQLSAINTPPAMINVWYEAIGHWALSAGILGINNELSSLAEKLAAVEQQSGQPLTKRHVIAAYRLALSFGRLGNRERLEEIADRIERVADRELFRGPLVRAWKMAAQAMYFALRSDHESYLYLTQKATMLFQEARDIRNYCLWAANVGNAQLHIGQTNKAESSILTALDDAIPMKLWFVESVRVNLSLVLTRLGRVDEAIKIGNLARQQCKDNKQHRFECVACCYLCIAELEKVRSSSSGSNYPTLNIAEEHARNAIKLAANFPPLLAYANTLLARIHLLRKQPTEALPLVSNTMDQLQRSGTLEECEALIRLVYSQALYEVGKHQEALEQIRDARDRLKAQVYRLREDLRGAYIAQIPEHAETINLADQWERASVPR